MAHAGLHVGGAATPQDAVDIQAGWKVVVHRDGVQVAGDHDTAFAAQLRPRDDRVAVAEHLEVRERAQRGLDRIRDRRLVAGDRLDVDQLPRQLDGGGGEVERRHQPSLRGRYPGAMSTAWGLGLTTIAADGTVLDTWFPSPALGSAPPGGESRPVPAELAPHLGPDPRRDVRVEFVDRGDRARRAARIHPRRLPATAPAQPPAREAEHREPRRHLRPAADRRLDDGRARCTPTPTPGCAPRCSAPASRPTGSTSSRACSTT